MRAGGEPECLVDFWMQDTLREIDEAAAAGRPPPAHTDDEEIGGFMFDFLFAAQDASTSSLCWAVSALDSHPEVLARVRAEVSAAWSPDSGEPMTAETIQGMRYTQAAALDASPPLLRVLPHRRPWMREVRRPWIREGRGRGMRGRRDEQRGGERRGAEEQSASGGAARGGDD